MNKNQTGILKSVTTTTKVIALVILATDSLFAAAMVRLTGNLVVLALIACLITLVAGLIIMYKIEKGREFNVDNEKLENTKRLDLDQSVMFYNLVAEKYDERNTNELLDTHRSIICELESFLIKRSNSKISVLDLGGGTGRLIAGQFFNNERIVWSYLDNSPNMITQFRKNFENTQLQTRIQNGNINESANYYRAESFDLIILSFVLSSMAQSPDFLMISKLLSPGGLIIIADADPAYTQSHPYYSFKKSDIAVSLKMRSVNPVDLIQKLLDSGLKLMSTKSIKKLAEMDYSFILTFQKC